MSTEIKERTFTVIEDRNVARSLGISEEREAELDKLCTDSLKSDTKFLTQTLKEIYDTVDVPEEQAYCAFIVGAAVARSRLVKQMRENPMAAIMAGRE